MTRKCAADIGISQSRHSRRIVPITRSQMAFAFGLAIGERSTSMPKALIKWSKRLAKIRSRNDRALSGYRWGVERKQTLLQREAQS